MLLAGDVGGTKTLLGLFERAPLRPSPVLVRAYLTTTFRSFTDILNTFEQELGRPLAVDAAAVGVAGPVVNQRATLTNIAWDISAAEISERCGIARAHLINDLEAMAASVDVLGEGELAVLQGGEPRSDGNAVVIAAGTGLGEAFLHRVNGRLRPVPSEGGHADFAARTDREMALVRMLRDRYGRAEVEHVLSGPGLLNLHRFTHGGVPCHAMVDGQVEAALVSHAAIEASCPACADALDLFVSAYGAEAGNLALRGVATAGVFVGGGIAPKILPLLQRREFMAAFRDKPPMTGLLLRTPVKVILNAEAGLIGAAVVANEL
jgi:glucokinase